MKVLKCRLFEENTLTSKNTSFMLRSTEHNALLEMSAQPKHVNNEDWVFKGEQWLCIVIQRFHHKGETLCFSRCSCPPNRENTLFW